MITATVQLSGLSPYSQSRPHAEPKLDKETADAHEQRTWRKRQHVNTDGHVYLPPMSLKNCLSEAAKYLSIQIPGKGKSTYTKHFEAGVLVMDGPVLTNEDGEPYDAETVEGERLFLNADGIRGSGKRVWKTYPKIDGWKATATFFVLDETITEDVFAHVLKEAGSFIGIGRFRPRNNGFYGRFRVDSIEWQAEQVAQAAE